MADIDDAALNGGEQTPAPVTPAPAEPAPNETARQTVRRAFEEAQAKATERDEQARAPRAPADDGGEDRPRHPQMVDGEGKIVPDLTRDHQGRFLKRDG